MTNVTIASMFSWDASDRPDTVSIGENFDYVQPYWAEVSLGGPVSSRFERYQEIHAWAEKTFGAHTKEWNNPRWVASNRKYWFKHKKDRTMFVLRWS